MKTEILYENHVEGTDLVKRKAEIYELLRQHICEVTFVKVNGELRTMPCTISQDHIPAAAFKPTRLSINDILLEKTNKPRAKSEHNLSVWCTDKSEWRSFKVANVTHVKVLDGR